MSLNRAKNYKVQVFGESGGEIKIGKPLKVNILFVVVNDAPKETWVITSPGRIAAHLGLKDPDVGKGAILTINNVNAVEVDGDSDERRLIHGDFDFEKKGVKFSDSPMNIESNQAIVVIVPKITEEQILPA